MDDDILPHLSVINAKKTYMNKTKKVSQPPIFLHSNKIMEIEDKIEPLTTKIAIKLLLEGKLKSKVCRYCLNITPGLTELDQILQIAGTGNFYKVTIRDIVASFHPFKVVDDPNFPNKICQKCVDRALAAYLFTQQCERAERAMLNCFDDMYEKFEKLDPIDRPKKRGRQKLNPNYNVLHAEHNKVIDYAEPIINIVNIGSEIVTNEPELNDLECKKCWQVLPNWESLLNHEKVHPKTMWYHCRLCGKSFPKRNQLKKHNHRVHVLGKEVNPQFNKEFKCNECHHSTQNYIEHLQHMEKHKFRNIMEHLIEKRTDQLCAICLNNGKKMTGLDQMVCLHGGHPDLMGDKTLYTLLASTLPDKNSYKYQELYIPSQAQIMTISKKSCDPNFKNTNNNSHNENEKENFVFSYPVVITKNRFKTDHFYFYVFCDPKSHNNIDKCDTIDLYTNEVEELSLVTQTVDIVEIDNNGNETAKAQTKTIKNDYLYDKPCTSTAKLKDYIGLFEQDQVTKKAKVSAKKGKSSGYCMNDENHEKCCTTKIVEYVDIHASENEPTLKKTKIELKMHDKYEYKSEKNMSKNLHTVNIPYTYNFSNPDIINTDINIHKLVTLTEITNNKKDSQDNENAQSESKNLTQTETMLEEKKTASVYDTKRLTKDDCDKSQPYDNTIKVKNVEVTSIETADCQFCWIFKHMESCGYCKKPVSKTNGTKVQIHENKHDEDLKDKKIWQCDACLTNNNLDRISCHCCDAGRKTENRDVRLTFNNKTFFQTKDAKDDESQSVVKNVSIENNLISQVSNQNNTADVTVDTSMTDYNMPNEENDIPTIVNINMQTMDIETNNAFKVGDCEEMDVEENPVTINKGLDWNQAPIFNFNIGSNGGDNITANVGTNVKFSIGCATERKRKFKRVVRNIPKAFHK